MDILSLGKANKAKRAIKKVNTRLGAGIASTYATTAKRLDFLESKDPKVSPSARVSALEANTHINLNKHNLRVEALLNKSRFNLKDAVVDDLEDATGMDLTTSVNVTHDAANHLVKVTNAAQEGIVNFKKEVIATPASTLAVSIVSSGGSQKSLAVDFTKGTNSGTVLTSGMLSLASAGAEFVKAGSWTSDPITLDALATKVISIQATKSSIDASISYAMSSDGVTWATFTALPADGVINATGKQLKIKIDLKATETVQAERLVQDFLATESTQFDQASNVVFDGMVKPASSLTQTMTVDATFLEAGELSKVIIPIGGFQTIDKLEVM